MAIVGHTSGGWPIIWPSISSNKKLKQKNKRYKCKICNHNTTKNQLKKNGNKCHQCKGDM